MKHISYLNSSIVLVSAIGAIVEGAIAIQAYMWIFGGIIFGSLAIFIPCMFVLKLRAMYLIDTQVEAKKPVRRTSPHV